MSLSDSSELAQPEPQRAVVVQKPRANIYTAMLALSLAAIIIGCLCLIAELNAYNWDYKAAAFQ
jgi:hypothetical protein